MQSVPLYNCNVRRYKIISRTRGNDHKSLSNSLETTKRSPNKLGMSKLQNNELEIVGYWDRSLRRKAVLCKSHADLAAYCNANGGSSLQISLAWGIGTLFHCFQRVHQTDLTQKYHQHMSQ